MDRRVGTQNNQTFSVGCVGRQRVTGLWGYQSDGLDGITAVTCDDGAGRARTQAIGASSLGTPFYSACDGGYRAVQTRYQVDPATGRR